MQLLVPPQNLDPGIVSRLCDTPDQLSVVSQMLMPPSGQNVWSTDGVFMSGQGNVFFTGQGSTFALGKPK